MTWTIKDIEKLKLKSNLSDLKNIEGANEPKARKRGKRPSDKLKTTLNGKVSIEKESIKKLLWWYKRQGLIADYVEELQFHDVRKFRFDWAIPDLKIAIEYEGLMSKKSGHTTIGGYTSDCTKYNLAQISGWKVLRYTAKNYRDLENDLKKILNTK